MDNATYIERVRKQREQETKLLASVREQETKLLASINWLSARTLARIENLAQVYGKDVKLEYLNILRKTVEKMTPNPSDTASIFETDLLLWSSKFEKELLRILQDKRSFAAVEKDVIEAVVSEEEGGVEDFLRTVFANRINIQTAKAIIKLSAIYHREYSFKREEFVQIVHLNEDEFKTWESETFVPSLKTELENVIHKSLVAKGLTGEGDTKAKTKEAIGYCVRAKKTNPKLKAYAVAKEAVEKYFPELNGTGKAKKLDAIRKTFTAKMPKRTKRARKVLGRPEPIFRTPDNKQRPAME